MQLKKREILNSSKDLLVLIDNNCMVLTLCKENQMRFPSRDQICELGYKEDDIAEKQLIIINEKIKFRLTKEFKWLSFHELFMSRDFMHLTEFLSIFKITMYKADYVHQEPAQLLNKYGFKVLSVNYQRNSINGTVEKKNDKFFFKTGEPNAMLGELAGYFSLLIGGYPVAKLTKMMYSGNSIIIFFEFDISIKFNEGLLVDYINKNIDKTLDLEVIDNILSIYRKMLLRKITRKFSPLDVFYVRRVKSRIEPWYLKVDSDLLNYNYEINGEKFTPPIDTINACINYFNQSRTYSCFLSQGDPNELNIGLKPIFFDYQTAGFNPLIAEIASFFWFMFFQSGYLSPKYYPNDYTNHPLSIENIEKQKAQLSYSKDDVLNKLKIDIEFKPRRIRRGILKKYLLMFKNFLDEKEFNDIRYFFVLRILGQHNVLNMNRHDSIIMLTFTQILFDEKNDTLDFLIKLLDKGVIKNAKDRKN